MPIDEGKRRAPVRGTFPSMGSQPTKRVAVRAALFLPYCRARHGDAENC